jgi:DNA modification methylase
MSHDPGVILKGSSRGAAMKSSKLAIEYRPVASLRLDPKNSRLHSNRQLQQIAKSIETFGFNVPVTVDADSQVMAGHGRVLAARLLGISELPAIRLEHLTESQALAFMIADNRLTENSAWNERLLAEQLKILSEAELDFSLEVTGFEMGEIDLMIENLSPAIGGVDDPADALPESSPIQVTCTSDLWQLGKHRVLCGDALSEESYKLLMGDCLAQVVFTDPPYNVPISGNVTGKGKHHHHEFVMASGEMSEAEFTRFLSKTFSHLARWTFPGSIHYVCMDWRHMKELRAAGDNTYSELKNVCVWVKDNAGMGSFYRSQYELVFVFKNGKSPHRNNVQLGRFGRSRTNVWNYPGANSFSRSSGEGNLLALHPTVKPVAMVADAIMDCSARGDIVIDPFLGSGTTLIAAERTGRICCGLELDPRYVDTAIRRWHAFTGQIAYRVADGQGFNELEKEEGDGRRK